MIAVHLLTYKTPDDESFLIQVLPDFLDKFPDNLDVSLRTKEFSAYWTLTGELDILFCVIGWDANFASVWYVRNVADFLPIQVLKQLQDRFKNAKGN
nr:MAG TPA: hypothetical protein [Caudoviricetes sp.]